MEFRVPQFVEIEDKIIGPLTLKQFLFLMVGAIILFALWFILKLSAFIIMTIPITAISVLFAFYKPNGRSFLSLITSFFRFLTQPRIYLWKKK